ncbi:D-3-phosphoglycerate dehydrogenase [Flavobacterium dankookense]|uniref:D-3-phosphoglycerate dehydrogenase n=2 Tax=Flavobacterium dankookense TaxID=706186 RepID=A0A4R6QA50_9FLAO|nr:D-3-phosphoglycerate dehydrogenase [Flavobacterium dankookense]
MTGKMKLLITESENFSEDAILELKKHFEVEVANLFSEAELIEKIQTVDVLFIRLRFNLSKEILSQTSSLKYILTATTGLDHINVDYFQGNGGRVISLKGEADFLGTIPSTAEHTWGLLLALMKKIPNAFADVKSGNWNRDNFKGNNLKDKKIGILGLGRVGKQVAKFAEAFQMEIAYFDVQQIESYYLKFTDAKDLFSWADIISIHIPYTFENEKYVDKDLLSSCNSNAILINTSRGKIWDETVVAEFLRENKIKAIATDVLFDEYNNSVSKNPLVQLTNLNYNIIITPHIAGATFESMTMTEDFIVMKFLNTLKSN